GNGRSTGRWMGRTSSRSSSVWRIRTDGTSLAAKDGPGCDGGVVTVLSWAWGREPRSRGRDDRADVLAGERAGDEPALEPVDDLHRPDVPSAAHELQEGTLDDDVRQVERDELVRRAPRDERGARI